MSKGIVSRRHGLFSKIAACAAMAVAGLGLTSSAQASVTSIVGVQYSTNNPVVGANTAGVYSVTNWNSIVFPYVQPYNNTETIVAPNVIDSTGAPTALNVSVFSPSAFDGAVGFDANTDPGDYALFKSAALLNFNSTDPLTTAIDNLNPLDSYELIVYLNGGVFSGGGGNTSEYVSIAADTATTLYALPSTGSLSSFVPATSTTMAGAGNANYAQFLGITGLSTLNFAVTPLGGAGDLVGVSGFQLIDHGLAPIGPALPEPASLSFFGLGAVALLRRRRKA